MKSSRIIIKNLPENISEDLLRKNFSVVGNITDLYMVKKKGKFRRVCFVGYETLREAEETIKYWNTAYICNHKISVDFCDESHKRQKLASQHSCDKKETSAKILLSKKIFIRGISIEENSIRKEISSYHPDISINAIDFVGVNKVGSTRNCIITFKTTEDALSFYNQVNILGGCIISKEPFDERKISSDNNSTHFNVLFFSLSSILQNQESSCTEGRKKFKFNYKTENFGSKITVAESVLINKTKEFLDQHNICYDKNTKHQKADDMLILRSSDIKKLVESVKVLRESSVHIGPSQDIGVIQFKSFNDAYQAKKTLTKLQRKKDSNPFFYCSFALINIDKSKLQKSLGETENCLNSLVSATDQATQLVIKNIPFQASESDLRNIFQKSTSITKIFIPKNERGESRGYCFITFKTPENLITAFNTFGTSTHLFGRKLILEKAKSKN